MLADPLTGHVRCRQPHRKWAGGLKCGDVRFSALAGTERTSVSDCPAVAIYEHA
jgi:hypothetical protein